MITRPVFLCKTHSIPVPRLAPLHKTLHKHKTLKPVDFLWKLLFLRKFPFLPSFFNRDLASSEFMISSYLWMIFFFFLSQLVLLPSSIFPLWFSHFYLGLSWFLRPSMCSLSVFLITHYLSFCSSSEISVAISKAFLWDLPDSIIKWIHGGVFVKMDPFFLCGGGSRLPRDTHSVFKNQSRWKQSVDLSASLQNPASCYFAYWSLKLIFIGHSLDEYS